MIKETIVLNKERNVRLDYLIHEEGVRETILVFPGGGYDYCSERESDPVAQAFYEEGFNAAILWYSVGDHKNYQNAVQDAEDAMIHLKGHTKVKEDRIAVVGFSAGGHLAASLSTFGKNKPSLTILGYPAILKSFSKVMNIGEIPSLSSLVTASTTPTFIFSTFEDNVVPINNTVEYIQALELNDVPFEAHIFQKGKHGLALGDDRTSQGDEGKIDPSFAKWFDLAIAWLNKNWNQVVNENEKQSIRKLMLNDSNRELILKHLPFLNDRDSLTICRDHTLEDMCLYNGDLFPKVTVDLIKKSLK